MEQRITQLKALANDSTLSAELRAAARKQLEEMGEVAAPHQTKQPAESRPPTGEFVEYRLRPMWERLLDPKPSLEKWLGSSDARERIRKHDETATRKLAIVAPEWAPLLDAEPSAVAAALGWYSYDWQHPRTATGDLYYVDASQYALLGQDC